MDSDEDDSESLPKEKAKVSDDESDSKNKLPNLVDSEEEEEPDSLNNPAESPIKVAAKEEATKLVDSDEDSEAK